MTRSEAERFARDWVDAWNSHDVERILAHYADDFEMSSPYAREPFATNGVVCGKPAVRAYWKNGLERVPDMRFRLVDVLVGVGSVAISYHTSLTDAMVVEVLTIGSDGRAVRGHAHYAAPPPKAAS